MSGRNPLTEAQSSALKHIAACAEARKRERIAGPKRRRSRN